MKRLIFVFFALTLCLAVASCGKEYDDTELKGKVDKLTEEVNTLKANQQAMQAVIDVWKAGGYVQSIDDSVPGQHTITFYGENGKGKTVVLYDGAQGAQGPQGPQGESGDSFFKSVTSDNNGVTFEKTDGTKIFIPFAKAFKLVIENPAAEVEAGQDVEFTYSVQNANESTTVDVFAGGNYAAVVKEADKKIVVTAPDPIASGSVLAWAQNDEGLFSMKKLSFTAKADVTIETKEEDYQAISGLAGNFDVDVVSNVDIEVPAPDVDWVSVVVTKASYKITLTLNENNTGAPRETTLKILRADNGQQVQQIKIIQLAKVLTIKTLFSKNSTASESWNAYFGGTAGSDRNIAMDDEYIYIAESTATAKLWAISIADPTQVKTVNVEGVSGGAHVLTCPRVVKNTDANVNGGKDVLICCNLTRGGVEPKLYMWVNGIDNAPKAITLTTWSTDNWYGDTFTVWGTLQDGVLLFDKTDTDAGNGVVTFHLRGVPGGNEMYLVGRIKTVEAFGSHAGTCAFYPVPDGTAGVYSPGRGIEKRGQFGTLGSSIKSEGGINITLTPLDYDEGTNAFVLGYNFIEWEGNRYVIYGNFVSNKSGYVRVRQGALTDAWSKVASTGKRLYRRDLVSGGLTSGNSAMDITARVIDGDLYFAAQMQNVGFGLYKLCYE